ncbi:hypothetical protein B9G55_10885 [Saccharibacillus sp. O16]|nr:hypothetical protein B9G55_10885 [Saccharibacillus sp. O16]
MDGTWRQAWSIVGREFKIDRYYILASLILIAYMGFFSGIMIGEIPQKSGLLLVVDLIFWAIASMIGYYFSKRIAKYMMEDSYTSMLAYYRTLPISPQALVLARMIQLLLCTLFNGTLFFIIVYFVHHGVHEQMGLAAYLVFAFTWTAFGLIFNCLYIGMELLMRGKGYFWYNCALVLVMEAIVVGLHYTVGSIVESSIRISVDRGVASPALWILLLLAAASIFAAYRVIVSRLPLRNLG